MKRKALQKAFPHTLPVMMGYLFMGAAFGILLTSAGYSWIWAPFMSIIIYAGSMQYVGINVLVAPFDPIGTFFLTLMVQARHLFYGLSLLEKFKGIGKKKAYMIFSLTDETYSLHCSVIPPEDVDANWFRFFIALLDHSYWITGCTAGALLGSLLTINTKGIDFVMTALFIVIFVEQWEGNKNHVPALTGILVTVACLLLFGGDTFLIPAMAGIMLVLIGARRKLDKGEDRA